MTFRRLKDIIEMERVLLAYLPTISARDSHYKIPRDGTRRQAAMSKGPILTASGFDTGAGFHLMKRRFKDEHF